MRTPSPPIIKNLVNNNNVKPGKLNRSMSPKYRKLNR